MAITRLSTILLKIVSGHVCQLNIDFPFGTLRFITRRKIGVMVRKITSLSFTKRSRKMYNRCMSTFKTFSGRGEVSLSLFFSLSILLLHKQQYFALIGFLNILLERFLFVFDFKWEKYQVSSIITFNHKFQGKGVEPSLSRILL